jgi:hypothetical protein
MQYIYSPGLTYADIWSGAVLATIGHAVYNAFYYSDAWYVSWDGLVYLVNSGTGTRGSIVFDNGRLVAAFCDVHSPRAPWNSDGTHDPLDRFKGLPDSLEILAHRALNYYIYDYDSRDGPVVTSAFWSIDGEIVASEQWDDVIEHGCHAVIAETTKNKLDALSTIQQSLELNDHQIELVSEIYRSRIDYPSNRLILTGRQREALVSDGHGNFEHALELFSSIEIYLE